MPFTNEELIGSVTDFDQLYTALREIAVIQGSERTYSTADIITVIEGIRKSFGSNSTTITDTSVIDKTLESITRTHGLRAKVKELLMK